MAESEASGSSDCSSPDGNLKFDQPSTIDMQLKCIIDGNLSFSTFESDSFLHLLKENYEQVSSTNLKRTAFRHYTQAKKDLIKYFKHFQGKVSLSIHSWKTSDSLFSPYISITCHWIDSQIWTVKSRVIALEQTGSYPYEAEKLFEFIMSSVSEFQVKDKIMSITVDDTLSADDYMEAIEKLKKELNPMFDGVFFHTKCVFHVLNSMVQSSLDYVAPVIKKFQNLYVYVFRSRRNEYKEFVCAKGAKFSGISESIPHEWDTIYNTLGLLTRQKSLLVEFYGSCGGTCIDDNEWETIESLVGILKVFRNSTTELVHTFPNAPKVLEEILVIANMFREYKKKPFWEPLILEMQTKLSKYYETMPPIFTCAAALNPKIGIGGVENILEDIAGLLGLDDTDYAKVSMEKCCSVLHQVFDCYERMYRSKGREIVPVISRNIILESVSRKRARTSISNELELYSKTDFQNVMVFDELIDYMLNWWKNKGRHQYPIMAEMVRDIVTANATSIPVEFAFCLNGRVLDKMCRYMSSPRWLQMRCFLKEHFDYGGPDVSLLEDDVSDESKDVLFYDSDEEGILF